MLPPAVAGIGLLVAFGRFGLLGERSTLGIRPVHAGRGRRSRSRSSPARSTSARRSPRSRRSTRTSSTPSRTLGAGPARTFFRVALPLARGGLAAGAALAFARGLGEFGATIMFAGSLQGVTQTLPLAIYARVRRRLRRRARDRRAARGRQRALLAHAQAGLSWRPLSSSTITAPLRSFELELALEVGAATVALVGPSGAGKTTVLRAIAGLVRRRGRIALGDDVWFDSARGIDRPPDGGASGSSSRSTRSSRT